MRLPRLCPVAAFVVAACLVRAASFDDRVETLFRPLLGEKMALSPDGRRIAYTTRTGTELAIVMMSLDPPGPGRTVKVEPERDASSALGEPPANVRFMQWATTSRLVFAPAERVVPLPPVPTEDARLVPNPDGPTIVSPIVAVDADGRQRGTLVDARDFVETPADARRSLADLLRTPKELQATRNESIRWRMPHLDVLGFFPGDREQLIIRTRGGYSIPMQHLVDIRTGSVREFGDDWPTPPGEPQVFDGYRLKVVGERRDAARPTTIWRDAELDGVQRALELKFPRRVVEILDWSETRARVLFRVSGGSDAGRIFVYQRPEDLALEILRRAPWLSASVLNDTRFFEFVAPDGAPLSGQLTWPSNPRGNPPPLLVVFPSGFPGRAHSSFDPETQILADLGFVVARLNHRSVAGVRADDLTALRAAVDRVSVDDARTAVDWIAARMPDRPFDRARVAALGRGFGGYLAVRAMQLEPAMFRCGIAVDAPLDLRSWLRPEGEAMAAVDFPSDVPVPLIDHNGTDWEELSAVAQGDAPTNPVLLMLERGRHPAIDRATLAFRARAERGGRRAEVFELTTEATTGRKAARAAMYRRMDDFLSRQLNDVAVTIGPAKEVE